MWARNNSKALFVMSFNNCYMVDIWLALGLNSRKIDSFRLKSFLLKILESDVIHLLQNTSVDCKMFASIILKPPKTMFFETRQGVSVFFQLNSTHRYVQGVFGMRHQRCHRGA